MYFFFPSVSFFLICFHFFASILIAVEVHPLRALQAARRMLTEKLLKLIWCDHRSNNRRRPENLCLHWIWTRAKSLFFALNIPICNVLVAIVVVNCISQDFDLLLACYVTASFTLFVRLIRHLVSACPIFYSFKFNLLHVVRRVLESRGVGYQSQKGINKNSLIHQEKPTQLTFVIPRFLEY